MDREARDPFELCEEMEKELGIDTYPVNWPIGSGKEFLGVYDREQAARSCTSPATTNAARRSGTTEIDLDDPALDRHAGPDQAATSSSRTSSCSTVPAATLTSTRVRHGKLSPVFFGSALTTFGVEPFLEDFLRMTTPPLPRHSSIGTIDAVE